MARILLFSGDPKGKIPFGVTSSGADLKPLLPDPWKCPLLIRGFCFHPLSGRLSPLATTGLSVAAREAGRVKLLLDSASAQQPAAWAAQLHPRLVPVF